LVLADNTVDAAKAINSANSRLEESQWIQSYTIWPGNELPKTPTMKIKKKQIAEELSGTIWQAQEHTKLDVLGQIIHEVIEVPADQISDEKKLYYNLMLDSIGRLELVTAIEREFNIDFDEEHINLQTTVGDLRKEISRQKRSKIKYSKKAWVFNRFFKQLRQIFLTCIGNPFIGIWCRTKVAGLENIKNLKTPVIFAPNHTSYFDQPAITKVLPPSIRRNLATAAWEEYFRPQKSNFLFYFWKRFFFYFCAIGWGILPFPQTVNHKKSMEYIGNLVDQGNHILIFPEGERTRDGEMLILKRGIEVLAKNLEVPIVPVGVKGLFELFPRHQRFPKRGDIEIVFGKPIMPKEWRGGDLTLYLRKRIRELI
jgi:long-chain acyl-CoA synthetase